mmetsp:Transcript_59970/g.71397  ORF Transcript_59970/g.71397 Transcript_59970/m.71397 type:complete len:111 (+) Transcript_59970:67-399(+)
MQGNKLIVSPDLFEEKEHNKSTTRRLESNQTFSDKISDECYYLTKLCETKNDLVNAEDDNRVYDNNNVCEKGDMTFSPLKTSMDVVRGGRFMSLVTNGLKKGAMTIVKGG